MCKRGGKGTRVNRTSKQTKEWWCTTQNTKKKKNKAKRTLFWLRRHLLPAHLLFNRTFLNSPFSVTQHALQHNWRRRFDWRRTGENQKMDKKVNLSSEIAKRMLFLWASSDSFEKPVQSDTVSFIGSFWMWRVALSAYKGVGVGWRKCEQWCGEPERNWTSSHSRQLQAQQNERQNLLNHKKILSCIVKLSLISIQ